MFTVIIVGDVISATWQDEQRWVFWKNVWKDLLLNWSPICVLSPNRDLNWKWLVMFPSRSDLCSSNMANTATLNSRYFRRLLSVFGRWMIEIVWTWSYFSFQVDFTPAIVPSGGLECCVKPATKSQDKSQVDDKGQYTFYDVRFKSKGENWILEFCCSLQVAYLFVFEIMKLTHRQKQIYVNRPSWRLLLISIM